jgi:hypothetical protein
MQQRHQHPDLKGAEAKGFKIQAPVRSKCADESEMKEIETGKGPVWNGAHPVDSNPDVSQIRVMIAQDFVLQGNFVKA